MPPRSMPRDRHRHGGILQGRLGDDARRQAVPLSGWEALDDPIPYDVRVCDQGGRVETGVCARVEGRFVRDLLLHRATSCSCSWPPIDC